MKSHRPAQTDWPVFGGNLEQTGLSPDAGPRTGEVAWKFPIGMSWYASAAVEDGRVYIASPGVTTLAYCLDEKTGKVIWTTPQDGLQIYSAPRASSTPVIQKDQIVLRGTSGSWEYVEKDKHVFYIDKKTGKVSAPAGCGSGGLPARLCADLGQRRVSRLSLWTTRSPRCPRVL